MPSRSRDRQLAKLAERRRAEKDAARHRRKTIVGTVLGLAVAIGVGVVGVKYLAGSGTKSASPTPSSSASSSAGPSASPVPFKQTGTVKAQPPPKQVACGATVPALAGKPKPQYSSEPPMKIDTTKTYTAIFKTSCGTIAIKLDAKSAPHTVNSFVFLAEQHFYDGQYFTRLDTSIAVVQGGDPTGTGSGGPGYSIPDELHGGETYDTGVFAMAKTQAPNSGGSQFFIITGPAGSGLNASPNYTIFGRISAGLDVAQKIQAMPITQPNAPPNTPGAQLPKKTVYIDSVTITVS